MSTVTEASSDGSVPLSAYLRARTAAAHADAESSPFFTALATGRVSAAHVSALQRRLLPVYDALERAALHWAHDPAIRPLLVPGLERAARLRADLRALGGHEATPSGASAAYAERVRDVATGSRAAFVAHHYTRCLGDLSGGQVIRAALRRSLGLDASNGASFLDVGGPRPGLAKRSYRAALDALPLTASERDALVAETLVAYRLNTALAEELDRLEIPAER